MSGGNGDLVGVLGRIKAKALIMPCKTDLYFPVRHTYEGADGSLTDGAIW